MIALRAVLLCTASLAGLAWASGSSDAGTDASSAGSPAASPTLQERRTPRVTVTRVPRHEELPEPYMPRGSLEEQLERAVRKNDASDIARCIEAGADITSDDCEFVWALSASVARGLVKLLPDDPPAARCKKIIRFAQNVRKGCLSQVRESVNKDASLATTGRSAALVMAARQNDAVIARVLLAAGADPSTRGGAALSLALIKDKHSMFIELINNGKCSPETLDQVYRDANAVKDDATMAFLAHYRATRKLRNSALQGADGLSSMATAPALSNDLEEEDRKEAFMTGESSETAPQSVKEEESYESERAYAEESYEEESCEEKRAHGDEMGGRKDKATYHEEIGLWPTGHTKVHLNGPPHMQVDFMTFDVDNLFSKSSDAACRRHRRQPPLAVMKRLSRESLIHPSEALRGDPLQAPSEPQGRGDAAATG